MKDSRSAFGPVARLALLSFLFLSLLPAPLRGQAVKASLVGTITDSSGAVVPAVDVAITEVNTNFTRSAISNESGHFVFVLAALP